MFTKGVENFQAFKKHSKDGILLSSSYMGVWGIHSLLVDMSLQEIGCA